MKKLTGSSLLRRLFAWALCVVLLAGFAPQAQAVSFVRREADASTLNDWKDYFGDDVKSSKNAGGVWTDKSVYADASALNADLELTSGKVTVSDPDHFLVALSAIASNKSITAHSTIPVDVVFVLDMSGSMAKNSSRIINMVPALNSAITELMKLNVENRVSVVVYNGVNNSLAPSTPDHSRVMLGLNRYTPNASGEYLHLASVNRETFPYDVQVVASVEGGDKVNVPALQMYNYATYMQNGLLRAWYDVFDKADITVPADGDSLQAGARRMPVMVVMSDGAPTATTNDFTNLNTSSNGGNSRTATTSPSMGFAVQLTASWVRTQMQKHYNSDGEGHNPLVYTMGVELDTDTSGHVAESVLNPTDRTSTDVAQTIDGYWTSYAGQKKAITLSFQKPNASNGVTQDLTLAYNAEAAHQDYVTQYFPVQQASEMNAAFGKIVHEIELQSLYFPTRADSGTPEHDGYVTILDDVGEYMTFDKLNGMVLLNKLYSGVEFASQLKDMGLVKASSQMGEEFIRSGMTRLGVSKAEATALVKNAWDDGQLYYNSNTDFGNSIGWYADANGKYLAPWKKDGSGKPSGAAYICHSYCFLEDGWEKGENKNLLYVSVQVREEIATGKATVMWRVPASMIPMVQNEFTISDLLNPNSSITRKHTHATPIRLIYEVGLRNDITEHTADALVGRGSEFWDEEKGVYRFHTNLFDEAEMDTLADDNTAQPHATPPQYSNTISFFIPNLRNERYFFEKDSLIYQKNGDAYEPYRGSAPAAGQELYTAYTVFDWTGAVKRTDRYFPISDKVLGDSSAIRKVGNSWYVNRGTVRRNTNEYVVEKELETAISPIRYANYPFVLNDKVDGKHSYVASVLGNNGVVEIRPVSIPLSVNGVKVVEFRGGTDYNPADFEFELQTLCTWETADGEFTEDGLPLFINVFDPPMTGDNTQLALLAALCVLSAAAFVMMLRRKHA